MQSCWSIFPLFIYSYDAYWMVLVEHYHENFLCLYVTRIQNNPGVAVGVCIADPEILGGAGQELITHHELCFEGGGG